MDECSFYFPPVVCHNSGEKYQLENVQKASIMRCRVFLNIFGDILYKMYGLSLHRLNAILVQPKQRNVWQTSINTVYQVEKHNYSLLFKA